MDHKSAVTSLLEKPNLAGLSYLLRHQELWPERFTWNFHLFDCCAMGLTVRFWDGKTPSIPCYQSASTTFDMPLGKVTEIFGTYWNVKDDVTPQQVADAIDSYLVEAA